MAAAGGDGAERGLRADGGWTVRRRSRDREAECYLPWEDKVVKTTLPVLPDFWRSIVVKFPTPKGYEPFLEAH